MDSPHKIIFQGHITKGLNGNGSGHDSDGTYMSSLSGSGSGGGRGGSVVAGRVGDCVGSISDLVRFSTFIEVLFDIS